MNNGYEEFLDWVEAQETMETQSYLEVQADAEGNLEKAQTAMGLAVIASFLYAITIVIRAIIKIRNKIKGGR